MIYNFKVLSVKDLMKKGISCVKILRNITIKK